VHLTPREAQPLQHAHEGVLATPLVCSVKEVRLRAVLDHPGVSQQVAAAQARELAL